MQVTKLIMLTVTGSIQNGLSSSRLVKWNTNALRMENMASTMMGFICRDSKEKVIKA